MEAPLINSFQDPSSGIQLVPLPANLVPVAPVSNPASPVMMGGQDSLQRMPDLQRFLQQCEDPSYFLNYHQLLMRSTPEMLLDFYKSLTERAEWLATEEAREYGRVAALGILSGADISNKPGATPLATPNVDIDSFFDTILRQNEIPHNAGTHTNNVSGSTASGPCSTDITAVEQHQLRRATDSPVSVGAITDPQTQPAEPSVFALADLQNGRHGRAPRQATLKRKADQL